MPATATREKINLYRLINPSDPYTFYAPDLRIAACVALFLGQGSYGAEGAGEQTPLLFGWDAFLAEQGVDSAWIKAHYAEIADALESVFIGDESHRVDFDKAAACVPSEEHQQWLAARHDRLRSSMNDIGSAAIRLAKQIRGKIESTQSDCADPSD